MLHKCLNIRHILLWNTGGEKSQLSKRPKSTLKSDKFRSFLTGAWDVQNYFKNENNCSLFCLPKKLAQ